MVAIIALAGIALVHVLDLPAMLAETPYLGLMFVGLIAGALACAGALARTGDLRAWSAAAALVASALMGFVISRTVGLPGAPYDVGSWGEPLDVANLILEGTFLALAAAVGLRRRAGTVRPPNRASTI